MKRFKAVVIGGTGYGGAEMIRRLLIHPDVELTRVVAVDHVGEPLGAVHPPLTGRSDLRFENVPPAEAARGADVALLGLPHKVSAQHAPAILATGTKVVDMSGDFRLRDAAAYARYYGATHPHPEALGTFVYGLPDHPRLDLGERHDGRWRSGGNHGSQPDPFRVGRRGSNRKGEREQP